jgi:hypothetical protein
MQKNVVQKMSKIETGDVVDQSNVDYSVRRLLPLKFENIDFFIYKFEI